MFLGLLLALNIVVCLALIGVVLLQRSEGGALGGGGGPTGLVTTRGAGDLLTRTTWILFGLFLALSLTLTLLGGRQRSSDALLNRLKNETVNPDLLPGRTPATPGQSPPPVGVQPAVRPAPAAPSSTGAAPGGFLAPPRPSLGLPAAPAPTPPPKP